MTRPSERRARSAQLGARANDRRGIQLGPRIRVGGSVGKIGQQVKLGAGKVLSNKWVDSALALIPGVGPGVSALANGAGHVLDTSDGGIHSAGDVARIGLDAGEAYLGGKAANGVRDAVVKHGVKGAMTHGLTSAKKLVLGGGSDGKGNFGAAGDLLGGGGGGNNGGGGAMDKVLLAGAIAAAAADKKRQQGMQDRAEHYATDSYDTRAPVRQRGQAMALDDSTSDLSSLFADQGNVYDNQKRGLSQRTPVRRQITY